MRSTLPIVLLFASLSCRATSTKDAAIAPGSTGTAGGMPAAPLGDSKIDIETRDVPAFRFLYIATVGPYDNVDAAFDRVDDYVARRDIRPAGSYCGIYYDDPAVVDPTRCHAEIGVAVADDFSPDPPFLVKEVNPGFVAVTCLRGADTNGPAIAAAIRRWIADHGYRAVGPVYELFAPVDDPGGGGNVSGGSELETQIFVPIAR